MFKVGGGASATATENLGRDGSGINTLDCKGTRAPISRGMELRSEGISQALAYFSEAFLTTESPTIWPLQHVNNILKIKYTPGSVLVKRV